MEGEGSVYGVRSLGVCFRV